MSQAGHSGGEDEAEDEAEDDEEEEEDDGDYSPEEDDFKKVRSLNSFMIWFKFFNIIIYLRLPRPSWWVVSFRR